MGTTGSPFFSLSTSKFLTLDDPKSRYLTRMPVTVPPNSVHVRTLSDSGSSSPRFATHYAVLDGKITFYPLLLCSMQTFGRIIRPSPRNSSRGSGTSCRAW